jgi:hypothetical protein
MSQIQSAVLIFGTRNPLASGGAALSRQSSSGSLYNQCFDEGNPFWLIGSLGQQFPIAIEIKSRIKLTHTCAPAQQSRPIVSQPAQRRKPRTSKGWGYLRQTYTEAVKRCGDAAPSIKSISSRAFIRTLIFSQA